MKEFKDFTGLYPVSKTLRFELKPDERTLKHIEAKGFLEEDEHRAESYKKVKKIIDRYHKVYIDDALKDFKDRCIAEGRAYGGRNDFDELLMRYFALYSMKGAKDEKLKKDFEDVQKKLRESIAKALKDDERFKRIDKEELITVDLPAFIESDEERRLIEEFNGFTTYFTGFNENRQNMYSSEVQSTAISYRLIHENLPKFIDNMETFAIVAASPLADKFAALTADMEMYLNVNDISDMFRLDYFKEVMTQTQIDVYNSVIGGRTEDDVKIQGLNEYINLYNQQQTDKRDRLPKLKPLYKQILSDRNAISWIPEEFKSDGELLKTVKSCYDYVNANVLTGGEMKPLKEVLCGIKEYELDRIWIANDLQLTDISQKLLGSWSVIQNAVKENLKGSVSRSRKDTEETYAAKVDAAFKRHDSFSIAYLDECLQSTGKSVEEHFMALGAADDGVRQTESLIAQIRNAHADAADLLEGEYPKDMNLAQDKKNVARLKALLDSIKELQRFIRPLLGKGNEAEKDGRFYGEFTALWDALDEVTPLYDKVRNYVTRKPYSEEKVKLNFANPNLLDGWDVNKEPDNFGVILRKDGDFFLGIMDKRSSRTFRQELPSDGECYEKMVYKQIALPMGVGAFVRKCFGSAQQYGWTCPESCMTDGKIIIKDDEADSNLAEIIDCYKDFFAKYEKDGFKYSNYGFEFKDSGSYRKLSEFFQDVKEQGFLLRFEKVSVSYIDTLVDEGKLYLFQIYNKDFSKYSKGTPNMHTLYWRMLFDEENLKDVVYKLNGKAEIFYRKSSIRYERPTHPAGVPIANKNALNAKKESVFDYDLIKDRRYTVDKFQFHVPITMNFKATGTGRINADVNEYIRSSSSDLHFIGIDRGERHLLYVCVIDSKGRIVEQYSLNEIVEEYNGITHRTNYHDLLESRGEDRDKARKSWQTIENIKDLKEGYLSQVIRKVADLMVKYQAPVILEDLNMGFKRGRQKVESSVYQQFEKQLIDKLNYLVGKRIPAGETGGLLHALQLTGKVGSFREMGKQCGFLFYIPAWNTSKLDPVTGFVNLFDTRYETVDKSRSFFSKFDSIRYNAAKGWFEFSFDYGKFTEKAEGTRSNWTLCTQGTRVRTFRNPEKNSSWDSVEVNLTDEFMAFFKANGIDIAGNLKAQIADADTKPFFEGLLGLLRLTLQMRNSITGTDVDYLVSPVADESGAFYDSRTCGDTLPVNADANGAYNIARKGLWVAQQIREAADDKVRFAITNKEWLAFAQTKPYIKE